MLELILMLLLSGTVVLGCAGFTVWLIFTGQLPRIDALLLLLCSFWLGTVFLYITRYIWQTLGSSLGSTSTETTKAELTGSREMHRQKQERAVAEESEEREVVSVR